MLVIGMKCIEIIHFSSKNGNLAQFSFNVIYLKTTTYNIQTCK